MGRKDSHAYRWVWWWEYVKMVYGEQFALTAISVKWLDLKGLVYNLCPSL